MDERERRIRERAHRLWEEEGRPVGHAERHWFQAEEIVAIEEGYPDGRQAVDVVEAQREVPPVSAADVEETRPAGEGPDVLSTDDAAPARSVRKRQRPARPTRSE